jgi:hypothetical protein
MAFERRRKNELTTEYLGRVLEDYLYFPEMAKRAREGHFDDYFCPPEVDDGMNIHRLVWELQFKLENINKDTPQGHRIKEVIGVAIDGGFDGTKEEAERWGASKEGQESFKRLLE